MTPESPKIGFTIELGKRFLGRRPEICVSSLGKAKTAFQTIRSKVGDGDKV
jgi:hypothetical protein